MNFLSIGGGDAAGTTVLAIDAKLRFDATFDVACDGVSEASLHRETVSGHRALCERRTGKIYEARECVHLAVDAAANRVTVVLVETGGQGVSGRFYGPVIVQIMVLSGHD